MISRFLVCLVAAGLLLASVGCGSSATEATPSTTSPTETIGDVTSPPKVTEPQVVESQSLKTGAATLSESNFAELQGQRVGLIVNQASKVGDSHIADMMMTATEIDLVALFAPEHGVRGSAGAGEAVGDEVDPQTGLTVFSLYGDTRKPSSEMLDGIDTLVFDLQDVGTRYYTYISTLGLAMQAAAESGTRFVVLDRPNPLGGETVTGFTASNTDSFISQYPIPSVYGLTSGELATMIVGEQWLDGLDQLDLTIVEMQGWERTQTWNDTTLPWIAPSPGLPVVEAALIYPATVLFEATTISYGQGTDRPFQQIGASWLDGEDLANQLNGFGLSGVEFEPVTFVPTPNDVNPNPRLVGEELQGVRINVVDPKTFDATTVGLYLLAAVEARTKTAGQPSVVDSPGLLDLLAGSARLRESLVGTEPEQLVESVVSVEDSWSESVAEFVELRSSYLRY